MVASLQWIQAYSLLHTRLHTYKSAVEYLLEPISWSIEAFQALQVQYYLYKHMLFYFD